MATTNAQRVGIWVIAVVLTVGTLAGFLAMVLAPQNEAADSARLQAAYQKYQKDAMDAQEKMSKQEAALDAEREALSKQYFGTFSGYEKDVVGKFSRDDAQKELKKDDLKVGDGKVISSDDTYAAYYVGWMPDGTVFDGSIDGKKLKTPLIARPNVTIQGWSEGVVGMKTGGVRMLTIPSEKAYGQTGSGKIRANTPLKFLIMPIRKLETIKEPEIPKELLQSYGG